LLSYRVEGRGERFEEVASLLLHNSHFWLRLTQVLIPSLLWILISYHFILVLRRQRFLKYEQL
jgi:hypothetical protein